MPAAIVTGAIVADAWPWLALRRRPRRPARRRPVLMRGRGGDLPAGGGPSPASPGSPIALAFFGVLLFVGDSGGAQAFLAGYLVEKSLSLDNVFVFLLVFRRFAVAEAERHRLLSYGIVLALVLRGCSSSSGAAALRAVGWLSFVFAAFLIWTGWRMFRHRHDHDGEEALGRHGSSAGLRALADERGARWRASRWSTSCSPSTRCRPSSPSPATRSSSSRPTRSRCSACGRCSSSSPSSSSASTTSRPRSPRCWSSSARRWPPAEFVGKIGPEISLPIIAAILGAGVIASLVRDRRRGGVDHPPHGEPRPQEA